VTTVVGVKVARDLVEGLDFSDIEAVVSDLSRAPERARAFQGSFAFHFDGYDDDPLPLGLIPDCRRYIQQMHMRIPHLPYFAAPQREFGYIMLILTAFAQPANVHVAAGNEVSVTPDEDCLRALLTCARATGDFARSVADDLEGIMDRLLESLPDPELVDAAHKIAGSRH